MSQRRSLALDRWEIKDFDPGGEIEAARNGSNEWLPVHAPGDTYQALIDAGRLSHPFQGRGEDAAAWVRDREWWWRTTFEAPSSRKDEITELVVEGLDTFAHVYLDGALIASTDNMFRGYRVDVTKHLRAGAVHQLAIRFDPPSRAVRDMPTPVWSAFTDRVSRSKRNLMRKAQFGWGWDWGPDLPTVGIWRPARLETRARAAIVDVRFATLTLAGDSAEVALSVELDGWGDAPRTLEISLADPRGQIVFAHRQAATSANIHARIAQPELWWTADLGAQPLYRFTTRLLDGEHVVDEAVRMVGIRTIALDQSPDLDEPPATFFRFVLNGIPIFAKGACWVPTDSFVGDVDEAAYRRLFEVAVSANMNMLRVWGGGVYEPDIFYDLCDEMGVLVWQDFMFACAHYPDDRAFAASVSAEVEHQVRRLRHHPCLALWCGGNESQAMHEINNELSGDRGALGGAGLYDSIIPEITSRLHPEIPYWPSSPWGGPHPNSMRGGDIHDWTVWHAVSPIPDAKMIEPYGWSAEKAAYTRYAEDTGRFISEFGIQAAPAMATLRRWLDASDLDHRSEGFQQRIKDEARKCEGLMAPVTGAPNSLQDYVDFSQWTQAEGLKFGIEHFRRRRPHCSGALLWQLNDCWPCVSWSLIDYDGVAKAAYYAVQRAFAPILASFVGGADATELWLTNDSQDAFEGEVIVALERLGGDILWREVLTVRVASAGHELAWRGPKLDARDLVLRVWSPSGHFPSNRLFAAPIVDLPLAVETAPTITMSRLAPEGLRVELTAPTYTPFVHIVSDRADLRFGDNYFDLATSETRTITVTGASAFGPGDISVRTWSNPQMKALT